MLYYHSEVPCGKYTFLGPEGIDREWRICRAHYDPRNILLSLKHHEQEWESDSWTLCVPATLSLLKQEWSRDNRMLTHGSSEKQPETLQSSG